MITNTTKKDKQYKKILEELKLLDDLDLLIILTLGPKKLRHTEVQKIAIILSKLLGIKDIDVEAYHYGGFSETIMEKLQSKHLSDYFVKENNHYRLTKKGLMAYHILLEKLKAKGLTDVIQVLEALRELPSDDIVAIQYFLFPEYTHKSKIKGKVSMILRKYREKSKKIIEVKDLGEKKIVKIEA